MTKPVFRLAMLGSWRLTADGVPLDLRSREQRVVALLALRPDSTRSGLAATLWPDSTRRRAHGNLRAALFNLRREAPGLVAAGKLTVALSAGVGTDVGELIKYAEHAPASGLDLGVEQIIDGLQAPELLPGWYEDWVDEERETQRALRLAGLTTLAQKCLEEERPDLGQAAAAAALVIDPTHEPSCELLVKAHVASAEPIDAIREFERFRERMIAELGLEPSDRLYRLAHGTVDGRDQRPSTAQVRHLRPVTGPAVPACPVNRRQEV